MNTDRFTVDQVNNRWIVTDGHTGKEVASFSNDYPDAHNAALQQRGHLEFTGFFKK